MANLCSNHVVFTGESSAIKSVQALFNEIQEKQEVTGQWHLPPYVTAEFSHRQDITVGDDGIEYETRWFPNLNGLVQIAAHYRLVFVNRYDERNNCLFGEARYNCGRMNIPEFVKLISSRTNGTRQQVFTYLKGKTTRLKLRY